MAIKMTLHFVDNKSFTGCHRLSVSTFCPQQERSGSEWEGTFLRQAGKNIGTISMSHDALLVNVRSTSHELENLQFLANFE